jgi:pilus assembly protein Flp/PilA
MRLWYLAVMQGCLTASHTRHARQDLTRGGSKMNLVVTRLRSLVVDDSGQDLLEYALLIALIALVCIGAVTAAGSKVSTVFTNIAAQIPAGS